MHTFVHVLVEGTNLLAVARGASHPSSEVARLFASATHAAEVSQSGRFAVVGDLLAGGALLIACGAFGLRRSR
jgi:hypothetical protein